MGANSSGKRVTPHPIYPIFAHLDVDKNKHMDEKELVPLLRAIQGTEGIESIKPRIDQLIDSDHGNDGKWSLDQLTDWWEKQKFTESQIRSISLSVVEAQRSRKKQHHQHHQHHHQHHQYHQHQHHQHHQKKRQNQPLISALESPAAKPPPVGHAGLRAGGIGIKAIIVDDWEAELHRIGADQRGTRSATVARTAGSIGLNSEAYILKLFKDRRKELKELQARVLNNSKAERLKQKLDPHEVRRRMSIRRRVSRRLKTQLMGTPLINPTLTRTTSVQPTARRRRSSVFLNKPSLILQFRNRVSAAYDHLRLQLDRQHSQHSQHSGDNSGDSQHSGDEESPATPSSSRDTQTLDTKQRLQNRRYTEEAKKIAAQVFVMEYCQMTCDKQKFKRMVQRGIISPHEYRNKSNQIGIAFQNRYAEALDEIKKELIETGTYDRSQNRYGVPLSSKLTVSSDTDSQLDSEPEDKRRDAKTPTTTTTTTTRRTRDSTENKQLPRRIRLHHRRAVTEGSGLQMFRSMDSQDRRDSYQASIQCSTADDSGGFITHDGES